MISKTAAVPAGTSSSASALRLRPNPLIYLVAVAYGVILVLLARHHEPWADEAQSWLLARDASLADLWGRLLHYEGTPGLWQTLVHLLIRFGVDYSGYGFISAALGLIAVILLLRYAPLPLFIRLLLPFTYFVAYQYAIIARSYALIAPLLFAIAVIYPQAQRRLVSLTALLVLLAAVSAHGLFISVCVGITVFGQPLLRSENVERERLAIAGLIYLCALAVLVICSWPANDAVFAPHRGMANLVLLSDIVTAGLAAAFVGHWILSVAVIALSLPFLWRGGGLLFFVLATVALCLFGTIIYTQLWHFGILFLAWLFAIWISAQKIPITKPVLIALVAAIAVQGYWTICAIRYDWNHAYSGSALAAQYLHRTGLPPGGLYGIGYPSTAVQPFFSANIYSNLHNGAPQAYWDWSKHNTADDPGALFESKRRELVLVGYKELYEKKHWAGILRLFGYDLAEHFEGQTFWETRVFEFESYDLYRQVSEPRAGSSVSMDNTAQEPQLLEGFYGIEGKTRWTAKNFAVLLKAPDVVGGNGAELELKLYVPDVQIQHLGAMQLNAAVDGHTLVAQNYSTPGEYTYSARVPAEVLQSGLALIQFRLDKASVGLHGDSRELGVVVSGVRFATASQAR